MILGSLDVFLLEPLIDVLVPGFGRQKHATGFDLFDHLAHAADQDIKFGKENRFTENELFVGPLRRGGITTLL